MTTQDRVIPIRSPEQEEIESLRAELGQARAIGTELASLAERRREEIDELRKECSRLKADNQALLEHPEDAL